MTEQLNKYLHQKGYGGAKSVRELYNDGKTIKLVLDVGEEEVGLRILTRKGDNGSFRIAQTW